MDKPNDADVLDLSKPPEDQDADNTVDDKAQTTDDTDQDTSVDDQVSDDADDADDTDDDTSVDERLRQLGLDKRYSTIDDALYALKHQDGTLTRSQQENAELRRMMSQLMTQNKPPEDKPQFDKNEFLLKLDDDPIEAIGKAGFAKREEVETAQSRIERIERSVGIREFANQIKETDPDLEPIANHFRKYATVPPEEMPPPPEGVSKVWDAMSKYYRDHPALQAVWADVFQDVYNLVTPDEQPPADPKVRPVSKARKDKAKTTPGGPGASGNTTFDWSKATTKEMEAELRRTGVWRD